MPDPAKILIVDDDEDFASAIRRILVSSGYAVDTAGDVESGWKAMASSRPDLVLLDVMMERLDDGFNMCAGIKHDDRYRDIPVIIVTAVTEVTGLKFDPKTDGEYLEADALLRKPVSTEFLLETVNRFLDGEEKG